MVHKVDTGASVLARLGGTLVYVILTAVTRIASWTLLGARKEFTQCRGTQARRGIPESTQNPTAKGHTQTANAQPVQDSTRD